MPFSCIISTGTDSSAVEHLVYTEAVGGSNPSPCTRKQIQLYSNQLQSFHGSAHRPTTPIGQALRVVSAHGGPTTLAAEHKCGESKTPTFNSSAEQWVSAKKRTEKSAPERRAGFPTRLCLWKDFLAVKKFFAVARCTDFSAAFTNFSYTQSGKVRSVKLQTLK